MARKRNSQESHPRERDPLANSPAQQDEADIVAEVGAQLDESGELVASEEAIREIGAVDANAVRENRAMEEYVNKKRGNVEGATFNSDDLLLRYEAAIKLWTANTLDISIRRLTGPPAQHTVTSRPRSGIELYDVIRRIHGELNEAEYEVKFFDTNRKVFRGTGRITMPDGRPPAQQGQPMQAPPIYQHPHYPQAPQFGAPQPPPLSAAAPAPQSFDPMAMMRQMFDMFQQMQTSVQPPQTPQAPPQFVMPPPPAQTDPAAMASWTQQMFGLFQQMQAQMQQRPAAAVQAAPPPPPPPPAVDPMAMMTQMFGLFQQMQEAVRPPPSPDPPPYRGGGPFRARPSGYDPRDPRDMPPPGYGGHAPPPPPPPPKTVAEQFRESMSIVRTAVDAMQEMSSLLPGQQSGQVDMSPEEDDSPIKIIDTGSGKFAVNKDNGSLRWGETGMMLVPSLLKWFGEQHEVIQKANKERQLRSQAPQQQLPEGFVEVHPGYRPPPGFVAVPIDPRQMPTTPDNPLPPEPAHVPPPVEEAPKRAWGMPTIPGEEEG
jgi:hypothetical protein